MRFTVITKVADPTTIGNMSVGFPYIQVEDPASSNGWKGRCEPLSSHLGMLALAVRVPVFRVGEVLVLEGDRDLWGRNPSKWDVQTEEFDTFEAAHRRAVEVIGE